MSSFGDIGSRRAPCPNCIREQRVTTVFEKIENWNDEEAEVQGTNEYYVFQCNGCETYFFCSSSACSEDTDDYYDEQGEHVREYPFRRTYLPEIPKRKAKRLPRFPMLYKHRKLYLILDETYNAIDNNLSTLAAVGIRTSFDYASEILGIDTGLPFKEKLEKLRKRHFISGQDKGALEVLVDAGGAAAHRAWVPTDEVLETLVEVLNNFIDAKILRPEKLKRVREQIPARK